MPIEGPEMAPVLRRSLFATIHCPAPDPYPLTRAAFELLLARVSRANSSQSFRGMQRVMARTIRNLWRRRPSGIERIDACHLDFMPEIERLAYYYWEQRGRLEGSYDEDWLRAEREFQSAT
jgi:hypothetical protein